MNSFTHGAMYRLLVPTLLFVLSHSGLVRVPKIYNALISSDENLQPSQAYPLIEPVLRTTALGVAFPPIILRPDTKDVQNSEPAKEMANESAKSSEDKPKKQNSGISYQDSLYPVAVDPYYPYPYRPDLLVPALPSFYQQPAIFTDSGRTNGENVKTETEQPQPILNFKKNPEIPDVPPPPLPVKSEKRKREVYLI